MIHNQDGKRLRQEQLLDRCKTADALLAFMSTHVNVQFLRACPKLRIISGALKGFDNFDVNACTKHSIWFCRVEEGLGAPTAELAIGLALGLARRILEGDAFVRNGRFTGWQPRLFGSSFINSVMGIIGMGEVGRELVGRLKGFGCKVVYYDSKRLGIRQERMLQAEFHEKEQLLKSSDFVFVLLPLVATTIRFISRAQLTQMKPGALLINVGRGSLVDEGAVAKALTEGTLGGYAADTFTLEDRRFSSGTRRIPKLLLQHPKTVFTPHLGTAISTVRENIEMQAAEAIIDLCRGRRPRGAVNSF